MNIEKAKEYLEYLIENLHQDEFYPTLLLFERHGIRPEQLNANVLEKAYELTDKKYEHIYDEGLRDEIDCLKQFLNINKNKNRDER